MVTGPEWTLLEYTSPTGRTPIREFLGSLKGRHEEDAIALLARLRAFGNTLRRPTSAQVEAELFELRGHQVRLFYTFRPGRRIVLLDGMIKKQDRIPQDILRRVRGYLREVQQSEA